MAANADVAEFFEGNVRIVGPYGYQAEPRQQFEERIYDLPGCPDRVSFKAQRLTPVANHAQTFFVNTPSGRFHVARILVGPNRVRVRIEKVGEGLPR